MNKLDKLVELLNEREEKEKTSKIKWRIDNNPIGIYGYVGEYGLGFASKMIIISKEYDFIKWLVDNDKIDYHNKINYDISLAINRVLKKTTREERLLMMLAIQDEPIEFLISILK